MAKLSYKQRSFIEAYLATWNASEAARQAGYKQAHSQGPRLLENVEVKATVERRLSEMAMSANEVLARLSEQARASIADFIKEEWVTIDDEKVKRIVIDVDAVKQRGHLIKKLDGKENRIELHDAQNALITLGRYHKLFTDRTELSGDVVIKVIYDETRLDA